MNGWMICMYTSDWERFAEKRYTMDSRLWMVDELVEVSPGLYTVPSEHLAVVKTRHSQQVWKCSLFCSKASHTQTRMSYFLSLITSYPARTMLLLERY
jgi:hypothetical protein